MNDREKKAMEEMKVDASDQAEVLENKIDEATTVCHVHDGDNNHVGTGKAYVLPQAIQEAADEAYRKGENIRKGSFGCGDSDDEAHERATSSNSSNATGLPGEGDFL